MTKPLKIVLVDDDRVTLDVLSAALEARGHDVVVRDTALGTARTISANGLRSWSST